MYPTDVMDDLFYEEAEGFAEMDNDDEFDEADDAFEAYDDGFEEMDDDFEEDDDDAFAASYDSYDSDESDNFDDLEYDDEFEDEDDEFDELDALDDAVAEALDSEDTDEFLRKLGRRLRKRVRKGSKKVGRIARGVAKVANYIPGPQARVVGGIANLLGRLRADGADEFEAIDALTDFAEYTDELDAAAPIIAGLALKQQKIPAIATAPKSKRRKLIKQTKKATKLLANRRGTQTTKAMTEVVKAAKTLTKKTGQPITQTIPRAAVAVAQRPTTAHRLARKVKQKAKRRRQLKGGYPYGRVPKSKYLCPDCGGVSVQCKCN